MTTIESQPDVVTGDVVIGPWRHYEFHMRGELFRSASADEPARVVVWLVNPLAGLKWKVCEAKAAYTISDVVFTAPFTRDQHYSAMWRGKVVARLVEFLPGLWKDVVAAQLFEEYMRAMCAHQEVSC